MNVIDKSRLADTDRKSLFRGALCSIAWTLLLAAAADGHAACNTAIPAGSPTSRFADNGDGTVTDFRTGLMWMRCTLGQTWSGATCTASPTPYVWADALAAAQSSSFAGHTDWRIPNVKELLSIVERRCSPAINETVFPATFPGVYWTSSPNVAGPGVNAVTVSFSQGSDAANEKANANPAFHFFARPVRVFR